MLSFLTTERLKANTELLVQAASAPSGTVSPEGGERAIATGRTAYFEALNRLQTVALPSPRTPWPDIKLQPGDPTATELLSVFDLTANWPDIAPADELREAIKDIPAAFRLLETADVEALDSFCNLVSRMIAVAVFAADFSGGGMSEGHNLGLVCFGMDSKWPDMTIHFAETFIHEATHQALFLEDMLHRVFTDEARVRVSQHPLQAYSTTRATHRPYDVSFHGACVTTSLEEFRRRTGLSSQYPEQTAHVARELERSVEDLTRLREQALTDNGNMILEELIEKTAAMSL
ncbi:aKG-HExxH-type peptide beta-hydroxylase [Nocardia sp. MW-W600-9]